MSSPFTTLNNGIQILATTPNGDAGIVLNSDFSIIANGAVFNAGTYSNTVTYYPGNMINNGSGSFYLCILTSTGNAITNATYFTPIVSTSNFVPYTGATGNVNLGSNTMTANTFVGPLTGVASGNLTLGGGIVTGELGALSGAFLVQQYSGINQIDLFSTNSGKTSLVLGDHNQNPVFTLESQSIANTFTITGTSSNTLLILDNADNSVQTIYNTLDDGSGNATVKTLSLTNSPGAVITLNTGGQIIDENNGSIVVASSNGSGPYLEVTTNEVGTQNNILDNGSGGMTVSGPITGLSGGNSNFTTIKGMAISGSSAISSGIIGSVEIPFNCTVTKWAIISTDGTRGSISFDIQQSTFGSALYTNSPGNSIVSVSSSSSSSSGASAVHPNLSNQITNSSTSFTNWVTTNLTGGDYLVFYVTSATSVKNVRLELTLIPR